MRNIKKINDFLNENINLEWDDIFRNKHTHDDVLKKNVIDGLVQIIMDENKISEKSFNKIDEIVDVVKNKIDNNILSNAEEHLQSGKRMTLFYEQLYDEIF